MGMIGVGCKSKLHGAIFQSDPLPDLLKGLTAQGEHSPVSGGMKQAIQSANINEPLDAVMGRLQSCNYRLISIMDNNQTAGIINLDNIMELVRIQPALTAQSQRTLSN